MKNLYFLRHGETDYNRRKIVQGRGVDADLNELGLEQAAQFYECYKNVPFELVITSALKRSQQSVAPFVEAGLPCEQYDLIDEIDWGEKEGQLPSKEMHDDYLYIKGEWAKGNYDVRSEGGESAAELMRRIQRFFDILLAKEEKTILICSHGRTLAAISCVLAHRPLKDMQLFAHHNTALTHAVYDGGNFRIISKNDTKHLE